MFSAVYDLNLNKLDTEKLVGYDELSKDDDTLVVSYDGVYNSTISNVNILKIVNKHLDDKSINPHKLVPNYLKKTEAEENLND